MAGRHGTSMYTRDLALQLLRRGHTPVVYTPEIGDVGLELRRATVPVTDDLNQLGAAPDLIQGHRNQELLAALLRFPGVPGVRVCHGWYDEPPGVFPRILRYIPVDDTVRDRCLYERGITEDRIRVLYNWVDLERSPPRAPLPSRPARALVFSNNAASFLGSVREACARSGLELDAVGHGVGVVEEPAPLLAQYDLVFAKAKAAMEAMVAGNAVILCDSVGTGPMVTLADFDRLRQLNFGRRTLSEPHHPGRLAREISRYDAADAAQVTRRIRESAGVNEALDRMLMLYEEVLTEYRGNGAADVQLELRAASAYVERALSRPPELRDSVRLGVWIILRAIFVRLRRLPGLRSLPRSSRFMRWAHRVSDRMRPKR